MDPSYGEIRVIKVRVLESLLQFNSRFDKNKKTFSKIRNFLALSFNRKIIIDGCVAFAKRVGGTRIEAELLPQCWEQVTFANFHFH